MKNNFALILVSLVLAGFVAVLFIRSGEYVALRKQESRSQAIDGCYSASSYTSTNSESGGVAKEPIAAVFAKCLELKNIK